MRGMVKLRRKVKTISSDTGLGNNNLVSLIRRITNVAGLWKDQKAGLHWTARIAALCFYTSVVLLLIGVYMNRDDTEKLYESFSVFTFCFMGILKLKSLQESSMQWLRLLSQVKSLENQQLHMIKDPLDYESDDDSSKICYRDRIALYTDKFRSVSKLLMKMYYVTLTVFLLSPFVEYCLLKIMGEEPSYPHILPNWAPLDDVSIFWYIVSIIPFEVVACVYCVIVHTAFDTTCVGLIIFICEQFSMLRDYTEQIGGTGKHFSLDARRDSRAHIRIKNCHKVHILLTALITELDQRMKNILGIYYLVATLTLCSVAVRLNTEEMSVMQLISVIQYMFGTIVQLYLFCNFGDAVFHQSTLRPGEGPFVSALWCLSPGTRREIHILSIGMMKDWRLRAGPFNALNLPSFIQIVRAAYSYYAVIRKQ